MSERRNETHLADELAILKLFAAYCHRCDDGLFADMVELFVPDGVFERGKMRLEGRAALLAFLEKRQAAAQRGRHLTLNPEIDVDGDRATAQSDFLFMRIVDGKIVPLITGRYRDDLVRCDDGRWRFARRLIEDWPPLV